MTWLPRYSGSDRLAGCMWLGRLIDKARQYEAAGIVAGEMLGEYMYGDGDYMDAKLLRFLGLHDSQISQIVRDEPDDELAARRIVERSGKTPEQCAAFNRAFARGNAPFLAMMDADEGRRKPGLGVALMKAVYNTVVFPIGVLMYRSASRKHPPPGVAGR
jgi:Domain of unknown function (DUF5069)